MGDKAAVRGWLVVAVVAVLAQESLTVYPDSTEGPHLIWGGISVLLLYGVYRGSRAARLVFLGFAIFGVALFGWQLATGVRELLLTVAYAVQATTMLTPVVRDWTQQPMRRRVERVEAT